MDIRSLTLFCEPTFDPAAARRFVQAAREAFAYPVQTARLALPPFADWLPGSEPASAAAAVAAHWQTAGLDYISLGPLRLTDDALWLDAVTDLLSATDSLFCSIEIADSHGRIDLNRVRHTARTIQHVSRIQPNGFGNLYLAALANCPAGAPYFPVAYHAGGAPSFAIAVEAANLARTAFQTATSLETARANLVHAIETAAARITAVADDLAAQFAIPFHGIDFSLAPFPTAERSLAGALEDLGVPAVGQAGSLFAAAFVTEAIGRADFRRCGFSGLMLPVLEDAVLARRAADGQLSVTDLLAYSAVCGVGLDTIPLPGDVTEDQITAVLLDVAALASRLNKPLTARLMPLPGLHAGDLVQFDFPYFADSRVMGLSSAGLTGLLAGDESLRLRTIIQDREMTP